MKLFLSFLFFVCSLLLFGDVYAADATTSTTTLAPTMNSSTSTSSSTTTTTLAVTTTSSTTTLPTKPTVTTTTQKSNQIKISVVESVSKGVFETQLEPIWKRQLQNCSKCQMQNITPYNEKGEFDQDRILGVFEMLDSTQILYLGWNPAMAKTPKGVQFKLIELLSKGLIIISRTGIAADDQQVLPLSKTLMASIPDIVIVGDLVERERLYPRTNFGPEMLTAIQAPKSEELKNIGALLFTSKLALHYKMKEPTQWLAHFKSIKVKTRKLWPTLNDVF